MELRFPLSLRLLTLIGLVVAMATPVRALPVFARKYETSCQTCHTVFPKLNAIGEAFRLNGYRLPAETEGQIKQRQVSLGAEAYKRMWPDAVWPSDLPGSAPLALNIKMADVYTSNVDASGNKTITHNDFQFPQEINLFGAGTLGEHMSFLLELTHAENSDGSSSTENEHARLDFDSILGPEHSVNIRIGKFAPNLYDGFQEMWITTDAGIDTLFAYNPFGFQGGTGLSDDLATPIVSLPARVRGIEVYGVYSHRFFYTMGIASKIGPGADLVTTGGTAAPGSTGRFNNNSHKDFYARFDYKFGGMGLDGDTGGREIPPENWRDDSLRAGLLFLSGNGRDVNFQLTDPSGVLFNQQDVRYTRTGLFLSWMWGDLNLFGVALHGKDDLELFDATGLVSLDQANRTFDAWFTQADWVIKPPIVLSARYEHLRVADPETKPVKLGTLSASYLLAANVKAQLEYGVDLHEHQNYAVTAILRAAF